MHLEINNLTFAYPDAPDSPIINIGNWCINQGESVFIFGPSGSGKSTLLNLLGGLLLPTQGSILIAGNNIESMSDGQRNRFRANHIGFVFQQFNLIPYLTPIENIQLACSFSEHHAKKDVENRAQALLSDLSLKESTWYQASEKLSVGEQQRVAIARALINEPELLIADEPTSSLDDANKAAFMSMLRTITSKRKLALIFVSHDQTLSSYFDRVESLNQFNKVG